MNVSASHHTPTDAMTAAQTLARIESRLADVNRQNPDRIVQCSLGASTAVQSKPAEALVIADQRMYANKAQRMAGHPSGCPVETPYAA